MAFINYLTKNLAIKIVYYGPGLSGKTTNLRYIYSNMDAHSRGELLCLETATERTFFFDLLPIKAGMIRDYKIHFQLLTVPGQVFYEASRKSVLKGTDGVVFVADSQAPLLDANLENFEGLRKNLHEYDVDIDYFPIVFQYNKRDLDNLIPVETLNNLLNQRNFPFIKASAVHGVGVFETLKEIAKLTVPVVKKKVLEQEVRERKEEMEEKEEIVMNEQSEKREEFEFVSNEKIYPTHLKKLKFKSYGDVSKEIEKLMRKFTDESTE